MPQPFAEFAGPVPPQGPLRAAITAAYRRAGIVMMYPSLRGGNDNPGRREGFLGEVDDILAAAEYLARESYVDPGRIYLGGHSTGGTLAMLAAEMPNATFVRAHSILEWRVRPARLDRAASEFALDCWRARRATGSTIHGG